MKKYKLTRTFPLCMVNKGASVGVGAFTCSEQKFAL